MKLELLAILTLSTVFAGQCRIHDANGGVTTTQAPVAAPPPPIVDPIEEPVITNEPVQPILPVQSEVSDATDVTEAPMPSSTLEEALPAVTETTAPVEDT